LLQSGDEDWLMDTRAILFDLDGTLTDTVPLIVQTYRKVFQRLDIPWGDDDVVKLIGLPLVEIAGHFKVADRQEFVDLYQHYYHLEHDRLTTLFPNTLETLEQLRHNGLKLGLVTSKGKPVTSRTLAYTGLDAFLEAVVTAHDVKNPKPHPEPIHIALKTLGVPPQNAIMVGDSYFDILSGQNAHTRTLAVTWGLESKDSLLRCGPTGVLDRWEEIHGFV